jgi:hypothetical protein
VSRILCVGGSVANLIAAYNLSQQHDVTLIELHAEIGMPSCQPGFIANLKKLEPYMTEEQMEFLHPHPNESGFGLRSEWMTKLLALNAAQQGVNIHTRTRIINISYDTDGYHVHHQGAGPNSKETLHFDTIIDASTHVPEAPGSLQHQIDEHIERTSPDFGIVATWFGGTALTTDCNVLPESAWKFDRAEGLSEVWFEGDPPWTPHHGWIEQMTSHLSSRVELRTIDAQIDQGHHLSEALL